MKQSLLGSIFLLGLLLSPARAEPEGPPPVDPALDRPDEPFGYFSRPTDQLGVMDGEFGFQVTAEGWLYTRHAEIVFLAGSDLAPVLQRTRTLRDGRVPILEHSFLREGVRYAWTMFAATPDGDPRSPLFAFVRIEASNPGAAVARAHVGVAVRHRNPPRSTARMRADSQTSPFRFRSWYAIEDGAVTRDEQALLLLPDEPAPTVGATLEAPYEGPFQGADHDVVEWTPVCPATWAFELEPGGHRAVDLVVPLVPLSASEVVRLRPQLDSAFDTMLAATEKRWNALFDRALDLRIPEPKARDVFWTSVANIAIARDQVDEDVWIQRVNELQYHTGFWPRDASYFMLAWWYLGLPDEGRRVVDHYFRIQNEDGSFQHDPENISPFAIARWFRLTQDRAYAEQAFPFLWRNFLWLQARRAEDPLHLMPPRGRYDNEGIEGHYVGHNFYNVCALREGAAMARALGKVEEAEALEAAHADYRKTLLDRLAPLVERYDRIPPGVDTGSEGANWGNLVGSHPTEVLAPDHPWIARTSDKLRREKYAEGLLIYDAFGWWSMHHYSTIKNTYSDLLRGRDDLVVQDLYALLAHTSASNAGFEFCIVPWSNRDFGGNFSPHGWFAAKYVGLVRLMLVREQGEDLHLLSALPPAWVEPGRTLAAKRVLTRFGNVDLEVVGTDAGCRIRVATPACRAVLLHLPFYAQEASATVDGEAAGIEARTLRLAPGRHEVELRFARDRSRWIDYPTAVEALQQAHRMRYDAWRAGHPDVTPFEPFPELRFPTRAEGKARADELRAREGLAVGCATRCSSSSHQGKPARGDMGVVVNGPERAVDGLGGDTRGWAPYRLDPQPWWEVDLGSRRSIGRVVVESASVVPLRFTAEVSADGETWTAIADRSENDLPANAGAYELLFPPVEASRLRLRFPGPLSASLSEVRVYAEPLAWQAARDVAEGDEHNLARGRPTLSSEWEGDDGPWKAVDGRASWGAGYWAGAVGHPQWWMVDLGGPTPIGRAKLFFYAGGKRAYAWVLQSSVDGVCWQTLGGSREPLPAVNEGTEVLFDSHPARYVRVVVLENTANPAAHLAELEVYAE